MDEFLTIVSGLPRSGTSMMMAMLEAGGLPVLTDDIRQPDADNPRGYFEFEPVKGIRHDASWLAEARGKAVKMVYRLLYHLPACYQYRVIFMRRNLSEVIASQQAMLRRRGSEHAGSDEAQLVQEYRSELAQVDRWLRDQPNISVLEVDYGSVLLAPQPNVVEIERLLGLGLDIDAMVRVPDRALHRQRS